MRIVLQHKSTGLYLRDVDQWTGNAAEAMDFVNSCAAIDFCFDHRIDYLQVVLKFDQEKCDIVMHGAVAPQNHESATRPYLTA